jgi:hypothetical protein
MKIEIHLYNCKGKREGLENKVASYFQMLFSSEEDAQGCFTRILFTGR